MATSVIEICNRALLAIGESTITALDQGGEEASLCRAHYEPVRDAVLREHPWTFACSRAELAASTTTPAFGFDYQYPLPSGCLRVLCVYDSSETELCDSGSWKKEGKNILADAGAPIYIKYVQIVTDPQQFDSLFDEALVARLAATMAEALTKSQNIKEEQWALYARKLAAAQFVDSTESCEDEEPASMWLASRY